MSESKSIMIVDDSLVSRIMLKNIIVELEPSWEVFEASNASEALSLAEKHKNFDMLTLDMNMPGKTGLSIAPALLEKFPHAKIALLTANIQDSVRNKATAMGLEFIAKPITEDKIEQFIHH